VDLHLRDRVALVTGGASGIGRACVDLPAEHTVPRLTGTSRADLGRPQGCVGTDLPVMQPRHVAGHAVFLASPVSAPINGTPLVADVGCTARSALPPLDFPVD
jgi:NAD(P)-dependent dehydrogenase (short-subunit alcohol dehydrogenase family)